MELVKIHGGDEKREVLKDDPEGELDDSNQTFHGLGGDMDEQSSDEEYDPNDTYLSEDRKLVDKELG